MIKHVERTKNAWIFEALIIFQPSLKAREIITRDEASYIQQLLSTRDNTSDIYIYIYMESHPVLKLVTRFQNFTRFIRG